MQIGFWQISLRSHLECGWNHMIIRISPRKTRLVADYIRGKNVDEALAILSNVNKKACVYIEELLRSALSNAKRNPEIKDDDLYISKLVVDEGPMLKRYRAGSMGRAMMRSKRPSERER